MSTALAIATTDAATEAATEAPTALDEMDLDLDMRVVEATTRFVEMMCKTGDGCGSTCDGSACISSSNDPS